MSFRAPKLVLSQDDYRRLSALLEACRSGSAEFLEQELGRAQVVPAAEVPRDAVGMGSVALVKDLDGGGEHSYTLVYPHEAHAETGRISVLAPLGVALLGLRAGDRYEWQNPAGHRKSFRVLEVA